MTSAIMKKPCTKCDKGAGVISCDGCQQSFCIKHIMEHRQELALRLDDVGQEHDLLRRDLAQIDMNHPLQRDIDEWEQQSITKIKVTAETARADLRESIKKAQTELNFSIEKLTREIQSGREMDDFTETDLTNWIQQLDELRKAVKASLTIDILEDEDASTSINLIKIKDKRGLHNVMMSSNMNINAPDICHVENLELAFERFSECVGKVTLSEDRLLATCMGKYWDGSSVFGTRHYLEGNHEIRFRIEHKGSNNILFGITTIMYPMPVQTTTSPYVYTWWDFDETIQSVSGHRIHNDRTIRTGDEITMRLDCDNRQIFFQHHRTNMTAGLTVDLEKCPLPWRILVTLRSTEDCIRILP